MARQVNWFYEGPSGRMGPIPFEGLDNLVRDGVITLETRVWRSGMDNWKSAGDTELGERFFSHELPPPLSNEPPPLPAEVVSGAATGADSSEPIGAEEASDTDRPPPPPAPLSPISPLERSAEDEALEQKYEELFGTGQKPTQRDTVAPTSKPAPPPDVSSQSRMDPVASAQEDDSQGKSGPARPTRPAMVGPIAAVELFFSRGLDPSGKATRAEFWWSQAFMFAVLLGAAAIGQTHFWIACLVLLVPSITQGIRRMHDIDQSGWWIILAFVFLPAFYLVAAGASVPYARAR